MNIMMRYLISDKKIEKIEGKQSWQEFNHALRKKKLVLFASGEVCRYFLEKYNKKYELYGIFDNNGEKQGQMVKTVLGLGNIKYGTVPIQKPDAELFKAEDTVILICTLKYIKQIYEQLFSMGYRNIFSLVQMEENSISLQLRKRWYLFCCHTKTKFLSVSGKALEKYTSWTIESVKKRFEYFRYLKYPIQKNKVVFWSEGKYKDHEKYISEKLLEMNVDCDIVWMLQKGEQCPAGVRCVYFHEGDKVIYEMATAKVWFDSEALPRYIFKRKGQVLIKTKHWSSITLKKFYFDTPVYYKTMPNIKYYWRHNTRMTDYFITGSEFDKKTCKSGFQYHGKFLEFGSPRTDIMFKADEYVKKIKEFYQIPLETNLVMYAPTFRLGRGDECNQPKFGADIPDFVMLHNALVQKFGGEWQILLRLHPLVTNKKELVVENCMDVGDYPDIQELLAAVDVVITDYSSLMFEPAMVGKKVFLYAPDVKDYCTNERGLWFELSELPFPLAQNDEDLVEQIVCFDNKTYQKEIGGFFDKHGVREDGHACERTVEFIRELLE